MATVSESQLNVLLAAAIKDYSDGWQNVDEELGTFRAISVVAGTPCLPHGRLP
jgi:hypothetical protein